MKTSPQMPHSDGCGGRSMLILDLVSDQMPLWDGAWPALHNIMPPQCCRYRPRTDTHSSIETSADFDSCCGIDSGKCPDETGAACVQHERIVNLHGLRRRVLRPGHNQIRLARAGREPQL